MHLCIGSVPKGTMGAISTNDSLLCIEHRELRRSNSHRLLYTCTGQLMRIFKIIRRRKVQRIIVMQFESP